MSPSPDKPLRVRFVVHHYSNRSAGMSGATYALGDALAGLGCNVTYYHFDDAFAGHGGGEISQMIRFPWKVAADLARAGDAFDVIDASTGDAWVWCSRGRPGARSAALVTRSHGLEHVVTNDLRARARRGETHVSWKYPVYHGGFRLWEVKKSLRCADAQIFLNEGDRKFAMRELGVAAELAEVLPNGVGSHLLHDETPLVQAGGPLKLAFIGSWIPRKGVALLIELVAALQQRRVPFSLTLLGTGFSEENILAQFPLTARAFIRVVPGYAGDELPGLLQDSEILLHPSWTEGFSLALVEGMARGLAPVATDSGGSSTVVTNGDSGVLLSSEKVDDFAGAIAGLAADRVKLLRMRIAARARVQSLEWSSIAARTLLVYQAAIERRKRVLAA